MGKYYGVTRSDNYLAHYGIPGVYQGKMANTANNMATKIQTVKVQRSSKPNTTSTQKQNSSVPKPIGLRNTHAYNNAIAKLQELQAAAPEESVKKRPIIDREKEPKGKTEKRKVNAANNVSYKQKKSDETYYANRNKYVTPSFSKRR